MLASVPRYSTVLSEAKFHLPWTPTLTSVDVNGIQHYVNSLNNLFCFCFCFCFWVREYKWQSLCVHAAVAGRPMYPRHSSARLASVRGLNVNAFQCRLSVAAAAAAVAPLAQAAAQHTPLTPASRAPKLTLTPTETKALDLTQMHVTGWRVHHHCARLSSSTAVQLCRQVVPSGLVAVFTALNWQQFGKIVKEYRSVH